MEKREQRDLKAFFAGLALPLFLLLLLCGGSSLFLMKSGEYLDLDDVIVRQEKTTGLYGSALHQRAFYYKQHLYAHVKPAIVTLGSSRVLQLRGTDFSKSFVNLGSMSNIDETIEMATKSFAVHKPERVILGIDVWWFHPDAENAFINRSTDNVSPNVRDLVEPFYWLANGKLSFGDVMTTIEGKTPHTGIAAITRGDGYSVDGSYHYNATLTGLMAADDPNFAESLGKIKDGTKIYAHGEEASQVQWKKLSDLLDLFEDNNVPAVIFLPPFAPTVTKAMDQQGGYKYISDARSTLAKVAAARDIPFFDFHEASSINASDCEFIDGHHGGPVVYQRILLNMAIGSEAVRNVTRLPETGWNIQNYGGQASMLANEADFLKIGCVKK